MVRVRGSGYSLRTAVEVHPGAWIKPGCGLSEATPLASLRPAPNYYPISEASCDPGRPGSSARYLHPEQWK